MSYPKTYQSWRRTAPPYPLHIVAATETLPDKLGALDVLIRIHAVSLNYRDVAMLQEHAYPVPVDAGGISASDCAAEVVAIGESVRKFSIGDRVAPTIDLMSLTGDEQDVQPIALGGIGPGVLREYAIFEEKVLVRLPQHLSWEEVRFSQVMCKIWASGILIQKQASTITCVGITAWVALDSLKNIRKDTTVLMQGEK